VYPELLGGAASGYDPGARSQCRSNAPRAAPLRRPFYRRRRAHFQHGRVRRWARRGGDRCGAAGGRRAAGRRPCRRTRPQPGL